MRQVDILDVIICKIFFIRATKCVPANKVREPRYYARRPRVRCTRIASYQFFDRNTVSPSTRSRV